jgi:hypothetical protein
MDRRGRWQDERLGYGERKKDGSFMEDQEGNLQLGGCERDCKKKRGDSKMRRRCKRGRGIDRCEEEMENMEGKVRVADGKMIKI